MMAWLHFPLPPFAFFFIAAVIIIFLRGRTAAIFSLIVPVVSFINLLQFEYGAFLTYSVGHFDFTMVVVDKISLIFAYLFHLAAFAGFIFAYHVHDKSQQVAALAYAGSAVGAVMSGDWLTLFVFWELLAVTSVFLIWSRRGETSYASGMRYLIIQVSSGVLLFAGMLLLFFETGDTSIRTLELSNESSWLIFIAFGIKCGFPLLHTWIVDAYPEATPTGTVFLCAFTTKIAIYACVRVFSGEELLLIIGLLMVCVPILYAVIENDLRRVLAYCLINQLGFMLCAISIGTEMAINGAVATAFNHVIYKGLLMMCMGAVLYRVGHVNASHLGGLYKTMPLTTILCVIGAASISIPLFSGFVSKAIIMSEVLYQGHVVAWLLLLFGSVGVFICAGIKVPFCAFFAPSSPVCSKEAPINMLIAMSLSAGVCIFIGIYPQALYALLPYAMGDYWPYDMTHVVTQLQLVCFSLLAFVMLYVKRLYPFTLPSVCLDSDWLYRKFLPQVIACMNARIIKMYTICVKSVLNIITIKLQVVAKISQPQGLLARAWGLNNMLLILLALMIVLLLFNYFY